MYLPLKTSVYYPLGHKVVMTMRHTNVDVCHSLVCVLTEVDIDKVLVRMILYIHLGHNRDFMCDVL